MALRLRTPYVLSPAKVNLSDREWQRILEPSNKMKVLAPWPVRQRKTSNASALKPFWTRKHILASTRLEAVVTSFAALQKPHDKGSEGRSPKTSARNASVIPTSEHLGVQPGNAPRSNGCAREHQNDGVLSHSLHQKPKAEKNSRIRPTPPLDVDKNSNRSSTIEYQPETRGGEHDSAEKASKRWKATLAIALEKKTAELKALYRSTPHRVMSEAELRLKEQESEPFPNNTVGLESGPVRIRNCLENKHILITGVTGFLAKVLVEKILRTQPKVGQLYLLVRAHGNTTTAEERTADAIFGVNLFKPLRDEYGEEKFIDLIVRKVTPVTGDIGKTDLDLNPAMAQMLTHNLDVIISSAATTKFDERYDTAININTLAPMRLLMIAKRCRKLSLFQHVSTAYVNGKRKGVNFEIPFEYGQSLVEDIEVSSSDGPARPTLDPEEEIRLAMQTWEDLNKVYPRLEGGKPHPQAVAEIVKLGSTRADMFGWHDTYTLTKALGEQMLVKHKGEVPVVIIRPSVVESTARLPFDGWIEGQRMLDPVVAAYAKGQLKGFLCDPKTILDVVPADIVSNVILASTAKHEHVKQPEPFVYQVASSVSNPLSMRKIADVSFHHFRKHPLIQTRNSSHPQDTAEEIHLNHAILLKSEALFHFFVLIFLKIPQRLLSLALPDQRASRALRHQLANLIKLARTYKPYVFYKGRFDATNTEKLLAQIVGEEQELFGFSVKDLDWDTYLDQSHLPGLRQHVLNWKQTGRVDSGWTIIDPLPPTNLPSLEIQSQRFRPPSRGLFQLPLNT